MPEAMTFEDVEAWFLRLYAERQDRDAAERMLVLIAAIKKLDRRTRAIMEKFEPDGSEWYENGEPFFDAVLNVQPWYRPCLVNEGSNLMFCQTADLINASKSQVAQFEQQQNRLVQKCFGKAPAGRSTKADNLMQGTEWWITDTLTAYSMKGAHHVSGSADHQLFLVTFHIGKRKRS